MRILVTNWLDRENPKAGGAEIHLHEVFGRLASRGHEITLLTSGFEGAPPRTRLDGMDVHRCGGRYTLSWAAPRYYRRALRGRPFDAVVEDLNKVPLFTPWWAAGPVVLLVHHLFGRIAFQEAPLPLALATWLLERPLPRVFGKLPAIAVSRSTADDLVRRGFRAEGIRVIPNGIDTEELSPDPRGRRYPTPTLLYLGRLKRYKRVDLLIGAVGLLAKEGTACRLLVAGSGDRREALEALVRRRGLQERVEFLGFVSEGRKRELLRRSWIHLLASPKEGWGISNVEAAACGTPTIASDSPGLRDSVRDGITGFLVPHGDPAALAARIAHLLGRPELREEMGRNARKFAEEFSWERSSREVERFLRERVAHPFSTM